MEETVLRVSIDSHKLFVVATDGYLTEPFETDIVHVHAGERYDFILKARDDVPLGTVYPIRIESVDVHCENHSQPSRFGFAYLKYSTSGTDTTGKVPKDSKQCIKGCIALNCPFASYPVAHENIPNAPSYKCKDVYDALSLLDPTPDDELSEDTTPASTKFFNHAFNATVPNEVTARVNNIRFTYPNIPFPVSGKIPVKDECPYRTTTDCRRCPHTVSVHKEHKSKPIEFVLSSLPRDDRTQLITKLGTHPIHLHGRSFWVKEIAYPEYSDKGIIQNVNADVDVPACGFGKWRNGRPSSIKPVNKTSIRKDTIIVPAGGYVVIEFVAHNPGSWLMHCHIDHHLILGMGLVIKELPECANPPPPQFMKPTKEVCISVDDFLERERNHVCPANHLIAADEGELPSEFENDKFEYFNSFNHNDNDESAYRKLKKTLDYEEEQQHPRINLPVFQNGKPLDGESREWLKKK